MSFRKTSTAGKRRRFAQGSSSSRRLSSVVNPDVLFDVTFHVTDEFSRRTPSRRHSISAFSSFESIAPLSPPKRTRAVSERLHLSKADQSTLLEEFDDGGTPQSSKSKLSDEIVLEEEDEQEPISTSTGTSIWMMVFGLFSGYLLSSFGLQKLNDLRPGCGQLVTFLQYVSTIAEKMPHARLYVNSPVLPMYWHIIFVLLMFVSIKMGNASLGAGLPFSLFLVIKNTNLMWALLLGLASGRSFTKGQMLSIATVTAGISICVLAQNQQQQQEDETTVKETTNEHANNSGFLFGSFLCAASTFCMAALGSLQEVIFARYKDGQEASESLFYTHVLGLPLFAVGGGMDTMRDDVMVLLASPATSLCMLTLNIVCTLVVKQCFVQLLEEGESVTATLTLAVARMTGVILSELLQGTSTLHFWIGALLVAIGSISYATGGRIPCKRQS